MFAVFVVRFHFSPCSLGCYSEVIFILSGAAFFHLKACNGGLESCIVIKSDFVGKIVVYGVIVVVISCFATTDQGSRQFMVGLGIVKLIPSTLLWWIGTGATAMMRMLWVF